jgi:hypothetical protein
LDRGGPLPNPNPSRLQFHLQGDVDDVEARVYTKAMVCVWVGHSGPRGPGWGELPLPPGLLERLGNGIGFLVLSPQRQGVQGTRVVGKLVVLR